jgi:hypothetical protein
MRLTDLEKFMRPTEPKKLGTREVDLGTKEVVEQMKRENSLAMAKIKEIPQETRDELKPYFSPTFFKEGNA